MSIPKAVALLAHRVHRHRAHRIGAGGTVGLAGYRVALLREFWISLDRDHETSVPEVANLGLVRPPVVYLSSIALGVVLHLLRPVRLVPTPVGLPLGVIVTLLAVVVFVSSVRAFRAAGTPVPGNRPTTAIVRSGPYRFSRNPIYLAFSLLQLGLSLWVNSLALLITLVPAVALMSLIVIPREERYLEEQFPSEYLPYKASVRRWL
jgi:protein-S-isoprenylcysteine O-methyltransferase Ste14